MTRLVFDAEAGTVDVSLTSANLSAQGTVTQQVTPVTTVTGTVFIRNAASGVTGAPIHGTKSYDLNGAAGDLAYIKNTEAGTPSQKKQAITMRFAAAPTADTNILVFQGVGGPCATVVMRATTGRIAITNANSGTTVWLSDATTGVPTFPCIMTFDWDLDTGTTGTANAGDGATHLNVYQHSTSTTTPWLSSNNTAGNSNGGPLAQNFFRTGVIAEERAGKQTSTPALRIIADSWRIDDGLGFQGTMESPVNTAPVAAIPTNAVISKLTGDTFSFTATATDSESNPLTYLWTNDTRPATAAAPTLTGATTLTVVGNAQTVPGVYTVKFKANDGTLDSNQPIGTAYYAAADGSISVKARRGTSAYTGAVTNLNDALDSTVVIGPDAAVAAAEIWDMNPCKPGDAFTTVANALTLRMRKRAADGVSDTTATITVQVDILTGPTDTLVTTAPRTFTLTNTVAPYPVQLSAPESAAFTNHNVWAIRVITTES